MKQPLLTVFALQSQGALSETFPFEAHKIASFAIVSGERSGTATQFAHYLAALQLFARSDPANHYWLHLRTPATPRAAAIDHGTAPAPAGHPGPSDCRVWLYSCGEAFGYSSLAPGDWAGFPDTDLLVVAANQAEAERAPIN
jgi:hypothetical protein